jgi:hypothetical protein
MSYFCFIRMKVYMVIDTLDGTSVVPFPQKHARIRKKGRPWQLYIVHMIKFNLS